MRVPLPHKRWSKSPEPPLLLVEYTTSFNKDVPGTTRVYLYPRDGAITVQIEDKEGGGEQWFDLATFAELAAKLTEASGKAHALLNEANE